MGMPSEPSIQQQQQQLQQQNNNTRNDSSFISSLLDQEESTLEFDENTTLQNIKVIRNFLC